MPLRVPILLLASALGAAAPAGQLTEGGAPLPPPVLFPTASRCLACHNGLVTPTGEDASIGLDWRPTMMANSSRDPYWQAAVSREIADHPAARAAIEDECAKCHMPAARYEAHAGGGRGAIFAHLPVDPLGARADLLAADGVSCGVCHQIEAANLGTEESFVGGFRVAAPAPAAPRPAYGQYDVAAGLAGVMSSSSGLRPQKAEHLGRSELCATCHTLYTHALGPGGEVVGRLPEQVPYLEWRASAYRGVQDCQDCHMETLARPTPIASVLGDPREGFRRHVFRGGNFFVLGMLNRHRAELGVAALPNELDAAARRTSEHLRASAATVAIVPGAVRDGKAEVEVTVENAAGHKLPTAYPSRRAWIHLVAKDATGATVFESGKPRPDGSIEGNDNDLDPRAFEPHHAVIERPEDVQIYEPILAGPDGAVTTGLLTATRYAKDNRILPHGFDKGAAPEDVAVRGRAADDPDFTGGEDRVRYVLAVRGAKLPLTVEAELLYQPISFRWASNHAPYAEPESTRFLGIYRDMAGSSWIRLAGARAEVR